MRLELVRTSEPDGEWVKIMIDGIAVRYYIIGISRTEEETIALAEKEYYRIMDKGSAKLSDPFILKSDNI